MIVIVLLLLIAIIIFLYFIFTELEKLLDNSFEIGNRVSKIEKQIVRIRKERR